MKMTIEVECSPEEARRFLGLPDVTALNDAIVAEMQQRMQANMAAISPEAMVKQWYEVGGQAQQAFFKLMEGAARPAGDGKR
jgi:hypothetical protein